ncbi:uncharacterized protein FFB14_10342 [Fusarium fujikuroi]|nr:uncharacterized protein FFB14_10342 [Fusarium fujikuroi]
MEMDDLAWERNDIELEQWERSLNKATIYREIANFIIKHRPATKFPDEKVRYEVATMRYVAANTTIPVPKIYHWGSAEEHPLGLGPFMIMEYIEHDRTLSHALNDRTLGPTDPHSLDPNISIEKLEFLYRQMNMNSILDLTGAPASLLPVKDQTFTTSTEWYLAMAEMDLMQLAFQQNSAVEDEDDVRDKKNGGTGFRLFLEDLRPSSVLVGKDLKVVGVIDWEFAYADGSSHRCDALIIEQSGVRALELHQLSKDQVLSRAKKVQSFEPLGWLWDVIVSLALPSF